MGLELCSARENTEASRGGWQPEDGTLKPVAAFGKFLNAAGEKLYVRGVTYGTFGGPQGLPSRETAASDLAVMAATGINALRTYTVPPRWFLDLAAAHGLRVLVGIPWEQHVTFLDNRARRNDIERAVRAAVTACAGHEALLGYAVGNEIPAGIVRWYGAPRIERFLERLYDTAKEADPRSLVTYANYPSTEYLELPFLDVVAFNVYLEQTEEFAAYVAHLHTLAGDRPLLLTELGLDSATHGEDIQARSIERQITGAFAAGCAGAFTFSWTDDWVRDGVEVDDWDFGLLDRDRRPKPALAAARRAYRDVPLRRGQRHPRASVIVCTHNGAATLSECLEGAARLRYPDYEVIVVDDGSTDDSASIAGAFDVKLISTPPRGLSAARNTGIAAAAGEIVAFLDDDSWPDPDWLAYVAAELCSSTHAGVGGPNIPPPDESVVARCVARAPGGPTHVLLSDTEAEHIAGCNMAFWKRTLEAVGGFDERFRQAGDDVDLCWRIRDAGLTLGFSPAAVVWHRRRSSARAYLRQQRSYGQAEALLEGKWPERHNGAGHVTWTGHVYGGSLRSRRRRRVIDYGIWGTGMFQSALGHRKAEAAVAPLMPEWHILLAALAAAALAARWLPILRLPRLGLPIMPALLALGTLAVALHALLSTRSVTRNGPLGGRTRPSETALIALLVLLQPLARLDGRMAAGLTPWRRRASLGIAPLLPHVRSVWSEHGATIESWLTRLEAELKRDHAAITRGGRLDRWDLRIRVGTMGAARLRFAIEEHGHGRQLLRCRIAPQPAVRWLRLIGVLAVLCAVSALAGNAAAAILLGGGAVAIGIRSGADCLAACAAAGDVLATWASTSESAIRRPEALAAIAEHGAQLAAVRREAG